MNILSVIKRRCSIRKYENKAIPKQILAKVIEAGIWGPSLLAPGFQPWYFVVVSNRSMIDLISNTLFEKSKVLGIGLNVILRISADTIKNAPVLIAVFNNSSLVNFAVKLNDRHINFAKMAELCAISAAIQNILLTAESFRLGACWLDTPLFCKKKIENILNVDHNLVAILALGYPAEKGRRSKRKPRESSVLFKQ